MTAISHTLVAGAIATKIHNPFLLVSACIIEHFILDSIPHWDFGTNWRSRPKYLTGIISIAETLIGIGISFFIFKSSVPPGMLLLAIISSILPDWLETPWYIFFANHQKFEPSKKSGIFERLTYKIYKIENSFHAKAEFPLGLITQITTVVFFLLILK
jgi:hypothetical protein